MANQYFNKIWWILKFVLAFGMFPRLYHLGQILYPWEHSESHNQVQNLSELIQIVLGYFITPYHGFVILFY